VTRLIAGAAGGRRLAVPSGERTRPTSARAREGLFSTLEALRGPLAGARFLDLYAGSGAVGLEALSRGAARVVLVESDRTAVATATDNARGLGLPGAVVRPLAVRRYLAGAPERFDVAFADPPYAVGDEELAATVSRLRVGGWLAAGAVVVVERAVRDGAWRWPTGVVPDRDRRYGEARLWYGRAAAPPEAC